MQINAINQTAFKGSYSTTTAENYGKLNELKDTADEYYSNYKESDKKNPIQLFFSVAVAGLVAFGAGKLGMKTVDKVFEKAPELIAKGSKKTLDFAKTTLENISKKDNKVIEKIKNNAKLKEIALKLTEKVKTVAPKLYKALGGETQKVVENSAGIATLAFGLPKLVTVDTNDDGIADITQKSVNLYKGVTEGASVIGQIAEILS